MLPLDDLTVLDFSTLLPGPMASLFLAEAGARVIRVERPGGEEMRRFPPRFGETSAPYAVLNRGKASVEIDLKAPDALARLTPLIEAADILIEQFRPGVMERLGFGYEALSAINPRLIYCSISGYGQFGPRAQEAGHDINYQAIGGCSASRCGPVTRHRCRRRWSPTSPAEPCRPCSTSCWRCASASAAGRAAISTSPWRTRCRPSPGTGWRRARRRGVIPKAGRGC